MGKPTDIPLFMCNCHNLVTKIERGENKLKLISLLQQTARISNYCIIFHQTSSSMRDVRINISSIGIGSVDCGLLYVLLEVDLKNGNILRVCKFVKFIGNKFSYLSVSSYTDIRQNEIILIYW